MLLRLIVLLALSAVLFAPITGYLAATRGRSFWRWYGLGLLLPFFSMFVALFVAVRAELAAEKSRRPPLPPPAPES